LSLAFTLVVVRQDSATLQFADTKEAWDGSPKRTGPARSEPIELAELRNSPPTLWCFAPVPFLSPV